MKEKKAVAKSEFDSIDIEKLWRLSMKEGSSLIPIELSSFTNAFHTYLTTYIDSEAAFSYDGKAFALADREGLSTVCAMLYAECKAAFPDLKVTVAEEAEKGRAYFVMVGTTTAKKPESSLEGIARATGRDLLSFHWAKRIAEASGFSLAFEWRKNRVLVAVVLSTVEKPAMPLQSFSVPIFDEASAQSVCRLLGRLPSLS